jgi:hypothetical protein
MLPQTRDIHCRNCGVEITWAPLVRKAQNSSKIFYYCCKDCLEGLNCRCGERLELEEQRADSSNVIISW